MRILVIADVHSNLVALEAVLDSVGSVDAVWHLGDVVGYGPEPNAVISRLRSLGGVGVRGNHDVATLGGPEIREFNSDARRAIEWTQGVLEPAARAWLAELPERLTLGECSLVHGSLRDPIWEYLVGDRVAAANLDLLTTTCGLHGHTHFPTAYRRETDGQVSSISPSDGTMVKLGDRRVLANPGSVGQPRDRDPRASALVVDLGKRELTWHRVAYDIGATQDAMRRHGLPARLVERLQLGL